MFFNRFRSRLRSSVVQGNTPIKTRRLAVESLEDRRLLSASTLETAADGGDALLPESAFVASKDSGTVLTLDAAVTSSVAPADNSLTYTLSVSASVNPTTATTTTLYFNLFFSSVGLDKVPQDSLKNANSSIKLSINSSTVSSSLQVPYFIIQNSFPAEIYSVVLNQDTGDPGDGRTLSTTDGCGSTGWFLSFTWNNSNNLWTQQTETFKLFDFLLPISNDAAGYSGTIDFNFAVRNAVDPYWTVYYGDGLLSEAAVPHFQIALPGTERLNAPKELKVDSVAWGSIDLSWKNVDGAYGYVVGWKKTSEPAADYTESEIIDKDNTSFTVTGLSGGTQYEFVVRAVTSSGAGNSTWSSPVRKTTSDVAPYLIRSNPESIVIYNTILSDVTIATLSASDPNSNNETFTFAIDGTSDYFVLVGGSGNMIRLDKDKEGNIEAGVYFLGITATADGSEFASAVQYIKITVLNPPTAVLLSDEITVQENCVFFVSGALSQVDSSVELAGYYWDWDNDGIADNTDKSSSEFYLSASELGAPNGDGVRTVQFWIVDSNGGSSLKQTIRVTVIPAAESVKVYAGSALNGQILKLCLSRFALNESAVLSWKILWDGNADWEQAETFDSTANLLKAAHYYAIDATETTYAVRLRLETTGGESEFFLLNHTVAAQGDNALMSSAQTELPAEAPSESAALVSAAVDTPLVLAVTKESDAALCVDSALSSLPAAALLSDDSDVQTRETIFAEPLDNALPVILWENSVFPLDSNDSVFREWAKNSDDSDAEDTAADVRPLEALLIWEPLL